jgi:hypothetical protein
MSFRTDLLATVAAVRAITGPDDFDVRTNQLTIRTRVWSQGLVRAGLPTDTDTVLPQHYPIRQVTTTEIAGSAGAYEMGDLLVDHITPSDGGSVGFTPRQLAPVINDNATEIIYVITGSHGGEYTKVELRSFRPFSYSLVLRRRTTTP